MASHGQTSSAEDRHDTIQQTCSDLRYILIQKVPEEKTTKNSCHVDFETDDREADVERLVSAGAIKVADHSGGRFKWTVLQDPEGNEFCIGSEIGE